MAIGADDTLGERLEWLSDKIGDNKQWLNNSRLQRGVKAYPAELYKCNIGKLT